MTYDASFDLRLIVSCVTRAGVFASANFGVRNNRDSIIRKKYDENINVVHSNEPHLALNLARRDRYGGPL